MSEYLAKIISNTVLLKFTSLVIKPIHTQSTCGEAFLIDKQIHIANMLLPPSNKWILSS